MDEIRQIYHDIRNNKILTKRQISLIKNMSDEEKINIITLLNTSIEILTDFINDL